MFCCRMIPIIVQDATYMVMAIDKSHLRADDPGMKDCKPCELGGL